MTGIFGVNSIGKIIVDIMRSNVPEERLLFIDDDVSKLSKTFWGVKVEHDSIGWQKQVQNAAGDCRIVVALGEKNLRLRKRIFDQNTGKGNATPASIIHSQSMIAADSSIEPGNIICRGAIVGHEVRLKGNSIFWSGCVVEHNSLVGESCYVSPNVTISGYVNIGDCTLLGSGAVVLPGISIGSNCIIGAGCVVTKDVPDNSVVAGNPGRMIRTNSPK